MEELLLHPYMWKAYVALGFIILANIAYLQTEWEERKAQRREATRRKYELLMSNPETRRALIQLYHQRRRAKR